MIDTLRCINASQDERSYRDQYFQYPKGNNFQKYISPPKRPVKARRTQELTQYCTVDVLRSRLTTTAYTCKASLARGTRHGSESFTSPLCRGLHFWHCSSSSTSRRLGNLRNPLGNTYSRASRLALRAPQMQIVEFPMAKFDRGSLHRLSSPARGRLQRASRGGTRSTLIGAGMYVHTCLLYFFLWLLLGVLTE